MHSTEMLHECPQLKAGRSGQVQRNLSMHRVELHETENLVGGATPTTPFSMESTDDELGAEMYSDQSGGSHSFLIILISRPNLGKTF